MVRGNLALKKLLSTLPGSLNAISPLKNLPNPKRKVNCIQTIHFQGLLLLVSGRVNGKNTGPQVEWKAPIHKICHIHFLSPTNGHHNKLGMLCKNNSTNHSKEHDSFKWKYQDLITVHANYSVPPKKESEHLHPRKLTYLTCNLNTDPLAIDSNFTTFGFFQLFVCGNFFCSISTQLLSTLDLPPTQVSVANESV